MNIPHSMPDALVDQMIADLEARKAKLEKLMRLHSETMAQQLQLTGADDLTISRVKIIINTVCFSRRVYPVHVLSRIRTAPIAFCRHVIMFLLREILALTFDDIGAILDRDHADVSYAETRIEKHIATDPEFAGDIDSLKKKILAHPEFAFIRNTIAA